MLAVRDIVERVAAKCDDQGQTYVDLDYVMGFVNDVQDWLFGKLRVTNNQFDEQVVILGSVQAGTPNLDAFQAQGQPLGAMVLPRVIRWRLPGQDSTFFRQADGPLDFARDIRPAPLLDSWAWSRYSVKLSNFSTALDLEVTGDFMFDQLTDADSAITISLTANRVFSCKLAAEVGKARGNDAWIKLYEADANDALDDLRMALTKENQKKTHRLARMSRARTARGPILNTR